MFRKLFVGILVGVMVLSLTACVLEFENAGSMLTGASEEYKEAVDISDKNQSGQPIELNLDMTMAKAAFKSTDDKLAEVRFLYSSESLKPDFTAKEDEINIRNRLDVYSFGKVINDWDVKITDKLPLEVELKADASDIKMDMSHMLISSMDAVLNASSARIYSDEPNKESLKKFSLEADASSVNIYEAGNLGFEIFDIEADASKLLIDLTGENERDGEVKIRSNASTVRLKLPENVDISIVIDNSEISSVNISNNKMLKQSEKEYLSSNYGNAERTLKIYVDMNVSTLTIE
jgi:hypothetical protein